MTNHVLNNDDEYIVITRHIPREDEDKRQVYLSETNNEFTDSS